MTVIGLRSINHIVIKIGLLPKHDYVRRTIYQLVNVDLRSSNTFKNRISVIQLDHNQ